MVQGQLWLPTADAPTPVSPDHRVVRPLLQMKHKLQCTVTVPGRSHAVMASSATQQGPATASGVCAASHAAGTIMLAVDIRVRTGARGRLHSVEGR